MKQNHFHLGKLFFCFLLMYQAIGQSENFGQMTFSPPAGWKVQKFQNGMQIITTGPAPNDLIIIQIMQPFNFSGSLQQAFEQAYNETCSILQVTKMNEVSGGSYSTMESKKSFKGWEYIRGSGGIQMNNGTSYPTEYGLELFLIKVNNRFERIAIVKSRNACGGLTRYYPSEKRNIRNAIENFLFSIRFSDWQDLAVKQGTVKGNNIIGVWAGLSMSVGLAKPGAELGAELKGKKLIFFSNGQAYFGNNFPTEGLDEFNTWIAAENNRRDWGFYSFNNGSGVLKMPYGDIPVKMDADKLVITTNKTDHSFLKLAEVDGARFNGNYIMSETYGYIPSISFTPDGRFIDKGALRVLHHEYTDCLNEALQPGSGSYEIKNHSVIFNYADGRKIKIAMTGNGYNRNDSNPLTLALSFNEDILRRQ